MRMKLWNAKILGRSVYDTPKHHNPPKHIMIRSREDYRRYLEADRISLGVANTLRTRLFDDIWKYQRLMRKLAFLTNCGGNRLLRRWVAHRYESMGKRLGFTIGANVFGPGLSIAHRGTIVVHNNSRIGANCRLHVCVNIGAQLGQDAAVPCIGDNCYIAPGAKLFGDIALGDNIVVGANAVVNKSFPEGNVTLGGVPARILSSKSSDGRIPMGYLEHEVTASAIGNN